MHDTTVAARHAEARRSTFSSRHESADSSRRPWGRSIFAVAIVAAMSALGVANIVVRAQWHQVEDGVFWGTRAEGVTAVDVARGSAAEAAGVEPGDILLALDGAPVQTPADVVEYQRHAEQGARLSYT